MPPLRPIGRAAIMEHAELIDHEDFKTRGDRALTPVNMFAHRPALQPPSAKRAAPGRFLGFRGQHGTPSACLRMADQGALAAPPPTVRTVASRLAPSAASADSPPARCV